MAVTEECSSCGDTIPVSATVHLLIHTGSDDGEIDRYVCRPCDGSAVDPLFQ
jgi:hypothetical protein